LKRFVGINRIEPFQLDASTLVSVLLSCLHSNPDPRASPAPHCFTDMHRNSRSMNEVMVARLGHGDPARHRSEAKFDEVFVSDSQKFDAEVQ
jgi:hypothetical protein